MAKLLIFVALCIASSLAVRVEDAVYGDLGACAQELHGKALAALQANFEKMQECAKDGVEELQKLEEELTASIEALSAAIEEQVKAFQACGTDVACKIKVLKEVGAIVIKNAQENAQIIQKHLEALKENFPETAECAREALAGLSQDLKNAALEFVNCVKA